MPHPVPYPKLDPLFHLERAQDEQTKRRLKRELEDIGHRLGKLERGLLF